MRKAQKRAVGQNKTEKGVGRVGVAGKGENGWGGRRHGLAGDGQNVRFTVTLTQSDMEVLEGLRRNMGSVTVGGDGQEMARDGLLVDGLPSYSAVVRRALRTLWLLDGG